MIDACRCATIGGLAVGLNVVSVAEVTVVSWNLGNYLATDRMTSEGFRTDYPKPESEKASLRAVLLQLRPDILLVQEIGDERYLTELQRDLAREGLSFPHRLHGGGSDAERFLGILSNWPLRDPTRLSPALLARDARLSESGENEQMRRGLLATLVDGPFGPVAVFTLHLKSRRTVEGTDPGGQLLRAAEARASREAIDAWLASRPGIPALVAGDFNCGSDASELRSFSWRGERQLWTPIQALDSNGETWTYHHARSGTYATLDHAFVSSGAERGLASVTASITPARVSPNAVYGSDHRPLVIRFTHNERRHATYEAENSPCTETQP